VWQVVDLLRGDYKPAEYRGVILPFLVLRRLDAVLEETKPQILAGAEQLKGARDDIAGGLFQNKESSNKLLKALLENEGHADAVQKIISTETWKATRRKHPENAA
jgi:type I restriction-modification system DNA methylase subunit